MASKANRPKLIVDGKRLDGRAFDDLRPLKIIAGVLKNANGSAYLEQGNNKVLVGVYGPREVIPKRDSDPTKAVIRCRYQMAPFSSIEGHGRTGPNRRATEISKVIKEAFEGVVLLEEFPNNEIDVYIEILQSDGGTRAAGLTAASVALANAGIPMKDLVYAVSAGKVDDDVILDLNMIEDNYSDADMPTAMTHRNNDILLLQMDGEFTKEQFAKALGMITEAGKKISAVQRQALTDVYEREEKRTKTDEVTL
jgi:exosome complex component RRP41